MRNLRRLQRDVEAYNLKYAGDTDVYDGLKTSTLKELEAFSRSFVDQMIVDNIYSRSG